MSDFWVVIIVGAIFTGLVGLLILADRDEWL